jgi:bla regulator protein blaR1
MTNHLAIASKSRRKAPLTTSLKPILVASLVVTVAVALLGQAPTRQSAATPQWQTDAGGKMAFDVASVKPNLSNDPKWSNVGLTDGGDSPASGSLFSATNFPLNIYIAFAYKLTPYQVLSSLPPQLPKWPTTERFDIEARMPGQNSSKDQIRLMMQSLLADRFKLAVHWETRQIPVYAFVLDKAGKTGPQLQLHSDDLPCTAPPAFGSQLPLPSNGSLPNCGALTGLPPSAPGRMRMGARSISMGRIAEYLGVLGDLEREARDKTGLNGTFDFSVEWTPEPNPRSPNFQPDPTGPTFLQALKEQLGLKLEPQIGPVDVVVIDRVEQPSEN